MPRRCLHHARYVWGFFAFSDYVCLNSAWMISSFSSAIGQRTSSQVDKTVRIPRPLSGHFAFRLQREDTVPPSHLGVLVLNPRGKL
jgi:hypothetical protein